MNTQTSRTEEKQVIDIGGVEITLAHPDRHPIDDPNFPSYQCQAYRSFAPQLEFLSDMFEGKSAWIDVKGNVHNDEKARIYLPPYQDEPEGEYLRRLMQSPFDKFFAPAVTGYPGLLADLEPGDKLFQGIKDAWKDIDQQGNNLPTFFMEADKLVLRDGFCGILTEMSRLEDESLQEPLPSILLPGDIKTYPIRPYLVLIERKDILNWATSRYNGKTAINRLTIRQWVELPKGEFGEMYILQYRVFTGDGTCKVYVIAEHEEEMIPVQIGETRNTLGRIPLTIYNSASAKPFLAEPPLMDLAELNRDYYGMYSEYRDAMHKVNCPTPVRKGLITPGQTDLSDVPEMRLGPNSGIDVPEGGDFKYAEPSGGALGVTREELNRREIQMASRSLGFLAGEDTTKTAEEVKRRNVETQASLNSIAAEKESVLAQIEVDWTGYYNLSPTSSEDGGGIQVNKELLQEPLTPDELRAISELADKRQISHVTALRMFRQGRRLPKDTTPEEEMTQLEQEARSSAALQKELYPETVQPGGAKTSNTTNRSQNSDK